MNIEEIRKKLHEKANTEYRDFNSKLCKDTNKKILGLKVPELRSLAKEIAKDTDVINIIDLLDMEVFEETMLKGLIIAYLKMDIKEKIPLIKDFIPNMDSWALTDTFCPTLKIKEKDLEFIWNFILPYTKSEKEFEVRFAIIMMLDYFVIDEYIEKILKQIDTIKHDGYYVKMGIAWLLAEIGIKYKKEAMIYLKNNNLDKFTYNKALQKMIESYRVSKEEKEYLRSIKRK